MSARAQNPTDSDGMVHVVLACRKANGDWIVLPGPRATISPPATAAVALDRWLERLQGLGHKHLQLLTPIVDGRDECDTLRRCIHLCTLLASPERALCDLTSTPLDEVIDRVFAMCVLASFLTVAEQGKVEEPITLQEWCCYTLTQYAGQSPADAQRIRAWYGREIASKWTKAPEASPNLGRAPAVKNAGSSREHTTTTDVENQADKGQSRKSKPVKGKPVAPPRRWPRGTVRRKRANK